MKKMTLEKLATMIKRGFDGVDKRFDRLEKNLVILVKKVRRNMKYLIFV